MPIEFGFLPAACRLIKPGFRTFHRRSSKPARLVEQAPWYPLGAFPEMEKDYKDKRNLISREGCSREWLEFIGQDNLERVCGYSLKSRLHPLAALMSGLSGGNGPEVRHWTEDALRIVRNVDPRWIERLRPRILSQSSWSRWNKEETSTKRDFSDSAAALGELRTYAALRQAFGDRARPVQRAKGKTADFEIKLSEVGSMLVEVHAKNPSEDEALALEQFAKAAPPKDFVDHGTFKMATREIVHRPFGAPKRGRRECTTLNMISRITNIKKGDVQLREGMRSLLWLDFQGAEWEGFGLDRYVQPLISAHGEITTGGIWAALYGRQGMPVFERTEILPTICGPHYCMGHEGRFYARTEDGELEHRANGVMVACSKGWRLCENPHEEMSLPPIFVTESLKMRWMDLEGSWLQGPEHSLAARLEAEVERAHRLAGGEWRGKRSD